MTSNNELVRAFIAIELPADIRSEMAKLQNKLRHQCNCPVKWVSSNNIHLTLAFLGEVALITLENAKQSMLQAVKGQTPFSLGIDQPGAFPNIERPSVIWIGLNGELYELKSLQAKLRQILCRNGLQLEEREFCPHLTLARTHVAASYAEKQALGRVLRLTAAITQTNFGVKSISLIQSRLTPHGPLYNTLFAQNCASNTTFWKLRHNTTLPKTFVAKC